MITVVQTGKALQGFFPARPFLLAQAPEFRLKIPLQFPVCNPAKSDILRQHADVHQLIQIAENTHLRKLGHSRQESKPQITVAAFQNAVKSFQRFTVFIKQGFILQCL